MAPRKIAEKLSMEILDMKPKRRVRKRFPTAKFLSGRKLSLEPIEDMPMPCDEIQNPDNVPQKTTKGKQTNKVNLNGIKVVNACKDATQDSVNPENVPLKTRRTKGAAYKQYQNITKTINVAEGITVTYNPENVLLENEAKGDSKQNETVTGIINLDEGVIEPYNPEDVVPKTKKAKLSNKLNHVTDELHNAKEELPKNKKAKGACRQKQNCAKIIHVDEAAEDKAKPKYVPTKINKGKATKINLQEQSDIKVMLANEVIRNAFQKKPQIVIAPRRGGRLRKKKGKSENNEENPNTTLDRQENIDRVPKKRGKNVNCGKVSSTVPLEDAPDQLTAITSESPATEEVPAKRRKLSLKRKKIKPVTEQSQNIDTSKEGKEETKGSVSVDSNATICNSNECTAPDSTSKTFETQSKKQSNISCRKNSGASTSTCFSWTKDISSSSTITCVTVKSNDFVRIDKKLPIVKLTNVDHKIKRKHCNDYIFEESSLDSHLENSKFPSECSSVSITNLNLSQTLNLSTSSLTSVTTNRTAQNNHSGKGKKDERILKLRQSLENLSNKMKNFDLEIVNWIGYENESKDANTTNFHARIFEVLNYENEVIKYCKEIKRVLIGATDDVVECGNVNEVARLHPEDNLTENHPSKNITDNSDIQNKDISEENLDAWRDKDAAKVPDGEELLNDSKSFEKDIDVQDNDDDDALSLFAESITGLESSRKNSSFALSVSNNKSGIQPDLNESVRIKDRVCLPITSVENNEHPVSYQNVNNVKKQTADSSTVFNKANDSNVSNKFQLHNNKSTPVFERFSNRCKAQNSDVSYKHFVNNQLNRPLFNKSVGNHVTHTISPNDLSENSSNRSCEFQNFTGRSFPNSFENNSFNVSQEINALPANISENWNNTTNEFPVNTNRESVVAENYVLTNPDLEHLNQSHQLTIDKKQMHVVSSSIFKSVCIFNLVGNCKNMICNFPHKYIDIDFIKNKLKDMNDEMFIRESMYVLKWPVLKRKYGLCYVEECIRRNLTVWLLQMVKDLISKVGRKHRDGETFAIEVIESTLLHLNDVNLEPCAVILRSKMRTNMCMCDHLMKVLSETQNFSRFKNVFIKLTLFMCQIGRSFRLDVATQLLERLCILPYDDALARALMKIIAKTNPSIFSVPMMGLLENQLMKNSAQLYNALMNLKVQAEGYSGHLAPPPTQSPRIAPSNVHQTSTPIPRADSPDTTNMDSANKKTEPVITRTITINRTINTSNLNMSVRSESSDEAVKRYDPRKCEATWRSQPPNLPSLMSLRPYRQVYNRGGYAPRAFNGMIPKFRRRPPQDPY